MTATLLPQVLVEEKSPLAVISEIKRGAAPEFVRVMSCAVLATPCARLPKSRLVADKVTAGFSPTIANATGVELPPPGAGLKTLTCTVPPLAICAAETVAVNWLALT